MILKMLVWLILYLLVGGMCVAMIDSNDTSAKFKQYIIIVLWLPLLMIELTSLIVQIATGVPLFTRFNTLLNQWFFKTEHE